MIKEYFWISHDSQSATVPGDVVQHQKFQRPHLLYLFQLEALTDTKNGRVVCL